MSVQDHPDIEKIAADSDGVIDGIPVRETIREIFRNPDNGTPDNISKAGCLALALKSNELGATGNGEVLWNTWRTQFPVSLSQEGTVQNTVNFSDQNFAESPINFSRFHFGDHAFFIRTYWGPFASLNDAQFGDCAKFAVSRWENGAMLNGTQWGFGADFFGTQWERYASFRGAKWGEGTRFEGTQWGDDADFCGAQFGDKANFRGSDWELLRFWYDEQDRFDKAQSWSQDRGLSPIAFRKVDFSGAQFHGEVDFSNRQFKAKTRFSLLPRHYKSEILKGGGTENVIFTAPPIFHGCEFHQDTSFEAAEFPDATGSEEAARAYRTLKLAFSKQQAIREEQRFFSLEMDEEKEGHRIKGRDALKKSRPLVALREYGIWFLYWLYKHTSDYGLSVVRPFLVLVMLWLLFAQIYGAYTGVEPCFDIWGGHCEFQGDWLSYSLQQGLPLPGLDKMKHAISGVDIALVAFQKTLSLAAIFLIGLALRNLFKLK